jgi:signal transduction histidine kinase
MGDRTSAAGRPCAAECGARCGAARRPRLLIAEDDALTQAMLAQTARRAGFEPRAVASVGEASALVRAESFDLALLDLRLRGGSGLALAERLREHGDVPFLFLTAHADDATVEEAARLGALGFLVKPLDPSALGPMLRTACARGTERRLGDARTWLAAELHDGLGQSLSGMSFLTASLVASARRGAATVAELESLHGLVTEALEDCRALARGEFADGGRDDGPAEALGRLAARTARLPRVACGFRETGAPRRRLPADAARHLYRIGQEALANAIRHGGAHHITIRLHWSASGLTLTIRDDGCGLAGRVRTPGVGLRTMQARAAALGGSLVLRPARPTGTEVRATVRLNRPRPASPR